MFPGYFTGFADEAGPELETQIRATLELGWNAIEMRNVKVPGFETANLHNIPDPAFEVVASRLSDAGVRVNCFGSALCNSAADITKPFDAELAATERAAVRCQRLGAEFIRVMSYPIGDPANLHEEERFRRLRKIVSLFSGTGTTVVHENCTNYGGMSSLHALRLLENVPGLSLVFDPGTAIGDLDYSKALPLPRQSPVEFYHRIKAHVRYYHIKDGVWDASIGKSVYGFPGEGAAAIKEILKDLFQSGYSGGLSIEPHIKTLLIAPGLTPEENRYRIYVEYGRRLMRVINEIRNTPVPTAN